MPLDKIFDSAFHRALSRLRGALWQWSGPRATESAMPSPIDWTPAGGIDAVRTLTQAVGPREAARRLGLSDAHADALRKRSSREGWMDAARPKPVTGPVTITGVPVTAVTKASDAMADVMADTSKRSKLAGAKYAAQTLEAAARAAEESPLEALGLARNVKETMGVASIAHSWGGQSGTERISIYGSQVVIQAPGGESGEQSQGVDAE